MGAINNTIDNLLDEFDIALWFVLILFSVASLAFLAALFSRPEPDSHCAAAGQRSRQRGQWTDTPSQTATTLLTRPRREGRALGPWEALGCVPI
jgi:hypothetical protein